MAAGMRPPESGLWRQVPGYDDDESSGSDQEERELIETGDERLYDLIAALGYRWVDRPAIRFSPPPMPAKDAPRPDASEGFRGTRRWSAYSQAPSFRVEHAEAPVIRETFLSNGLVQTSERDFMIQWSGPSMRESVYQSLSEFQKVNHFPGSYEMTRKDRLATNFRLMAKAFGKGAFDFLPETYVLPQQLDEFLACFERTKGLWIVKPNASSRGRGIFVLRDPAEIPADERVVVSQYIANPLLIQGLKFDIRFYVVVTSYDPLRAYIYREGLARFACKPYSTRAEHVADKFRHLTNYSINKSAGNFKENQDLLADNVGHKWSLSALNKHLKCTGVDVGLMWSRIMDMVVKTLLSVEPFICAKTQSLTHNRSNCFEVYGFDVIVDEDLKPWLLEVNLSPSMQAESPLDWQIKSSLLSDVFNLVGVCNRDSAMALCARIKAPANGLQLHPSLPRPRKAEPTQPVKPQAASGQADQGGPEPPGLKPVVLNDLSYDQLKLLARSMQENRRCKNFVRLYPTKRSIQRYAPITAALRARSKHSGVGGSAGEESMSQLLASLLFGPRPVSFVRSLTVPTLPPTRSRRDSPPSRRDRRDAPPSSRGSSSPPRDRAAALPATAPAVAVNGGRRERLRAAGPEPEDMEEAPELAAGGDGSHPSRPLRGHRPALQGAMGISDSQAAAIHQAGTSGGLDAAVKAVVSLGDRVGFKLVFMEYLARLWRACEAVGSEERLTLSQSSAFARLATFKARLRDLTALSATRGGEGGTGGGALMESLASSCRAALERAYHALWDAETGLGLPPPLLPPPTQGGPQLETYIPRPTAQRCQEALRLLQALTAADLEEACSHPRCSLEFRELFGAPYAGSRQLESEDAATCSRPRLDAPPRKRPDSERAQRRPNGGPRGRYETLHRTEPVRPEPHGAPREPAPPRGPLADLLLTTASARQRKRPGPAAENPRALAAPPAAPPVASDPALEKEKEEAEADWAGRFLGAKFLAAGPGPRRPPMPLLQAGLSRSGLLPGLAHDQACAASPPLHRSLTLPKKPQLAPREAPERDEVLQALLDIEF